MWIYEDKRRFNPSHYRLAGGLILYFLATVQFLWCYLWQVHPYVNTLAYEQGRERMPFQGRLLMMPLMQWAHRQFWIAHLSAILHRNIYWFPRPMEPEVLVQAILDLACVLIAGLVATSIYRRASRWQLLTPLLYPIVLVLCVATYLLHTIQNFRFLYDLPSLAFFSVGMWIIYTRKPLWSFVALFLVATLNRETTLLLLPIYALSFVVQQSGVRQPSDSANRPLRWRYLYSPALLATILPLALYWLVSQLMIRHLFRHNASEFYSRMPQNLAFLFSLRAWPQMLGACCYLIPVIVLYRRRLRDPELKAWLAVLPLWFAFMFVYGILIETRIFGELIPYVACATALIAEESLAERLGARLQTATRLQTRSSHAPPGIAA